MRVTHIGMFRYLQKNLVQQQIVVIIVVFIHFMMVIPLLLVTQLKEQSYLVLKMLKIKSSTRLVFILKGVVIKIPLSRRGYLQGKNEKTLWDKFSHLNMLGELRWEKIGIVCMKRYSPLNRIPKGYVNWIKRNIPELNVINCDLHNVKNWGRDGNSNPILIDYGINEYISTLY